MAGLLLLGIWLVGATSASAATAPFEQSVMASVPLTRSWIELGASTAPVARFGAAMAYDLVRQRFVLFGGSQYEPQPLGDTWEYVGQSWIRKNPTSRPQERALHRMAYDARRRVTVLFGGTERCAQTDQPNPGARNDTWEWRGTEWAQSVTATAPCSRNAFGMTYDGARQRVVVFGGRGPDGLLMDDTWEYDGVAWLQRVTPLAPPKRRGHSLTYDPVRGHVVLFGGRDSVGTPLNDTWEWNGTSWVQVRITGAAPLEREAHAAWYDTQSRKVVIWGGRRVTSALTDRWEFDGTGWRELAGLSACGGLRLPTGPCEGSYETATAFDAARQRALLFGGRGTDGRYWSDTWELRAGAWNRLLAHATPPGGTAHTMAYDTARKRTVLFLAYASPAEATTWEHDGTNWTARRPSTAPASRWGQALAYDAARGKVLLFAGQGETLMSDTWLWDGVVWSEAHPQAAPPPRREHALAYDSARRRVVLFGGYDGQVHRNDTWEWDGTTWLERTPVSVPGGSSRHAMAYDTSRGKVVLVGGNETWTWDGDNWARTTPSTYPSLVGDHAMAYDVTHHCVVLMGGGYSGANPGDLAATWTWDGDWTRLTPAVAPSKRADHTMVYDSSRRRVVAFAGGLALGDTTDDTWEWDGTTWTDPRPMRARAPASPRAREHHAMTYDPLRRRTVLFGGGGFLNLGDTWEWDGTFWENRTPSSGSPSPVGRGQHAMAYDAARARVVLFGGYAGLPANEKKHDLWEWDGTSWLERTPGPPPASPEARSYPALAFDASRGRLVLFGGNGATSGTTSDTWEWDGSGWSNLTPTPPFVSPAPRYYHSLSYDAMRGKAVLFGGSQLPPNTWLWDGVSWAQAACASPSLQIGQAMVYDSQRERVLVVAENLGQTQCLTWEWDGTRWLDHTPRPPAVSPPPERDIGLAYDASRGCAVYYKGGGGAGTWELPSNTPPVLRGVSVTASPGSTPGAHVTQQLTLTATTFDTDHDFLDFVWTQLSGPTVALSGADSSVASFRPTTAATYAFSLSVCDGREGWTYGIGNVTVRPNTAPDISRIDATTDCCAPVTLCPLVRDPDGDPLTYSWQQVRTAAPTVELTRASSGPDASFPPAPDPTNIQVYSFVLTADDSKGGISTAPVVVTVLSNPNPPVGRLSFSPAGTITTTEPTSVTLTLDFDKPVLPGSTVTFTRQQGSDLLTYPCVIPSPAGGRRRGVAIWPVTPVHKTRANSRTCARDIGTCQHVPPACQEF